MNSNLSNARFDNLHLNWKERIYISVLKFPEHLTVVEFYYKILDKLWFPHDICCLHHMCQC